MPVTSHFRTDAEALLSNGQWLPVVVDLREESGELIIESDCVSKKSDESECTNLSSPNRARRNIDGYSVHESAFGQEEVLPSASNIRRVEINKGDEGLGVSIKGGADHQMPVTISKIFRGMAADRTRQLFVGDTIISVNGTNLQQSTHEEAVRALRSAGHRVIIEVQYSPITASSPSHHMAEKTLLANSESLPPLSEIGWGPLTTLSPAKQGDTEEKSDQQNEDNSLSQLQKTPLICLWRRVCSLRLAGVHLLQAGSNQVSPSKNRSQNSNSGSEDFSNRVIRVHSPDLNKSIHLRFSAPPIAGCWLSWVGSIVDRLADRFRDRANGFFSNPNSTIALNTQMPYNYPGQFWQVGWLDSLALSPFHHDQSISAPQNNWQRIFGVITDREFLIFDRAPSLPHDHSDASFKAALGTWLAKHEIACIPLLFSRLVSGQTPSDASANTGSFVEMASNVDANCRHLLFGLRVARLPPRVSSPVVRSSDTPIVPIEWRTFRCDSAASVATWCRAIVAGNHRSVAIVNVLRFAVFFSGRICSLELSEDRISLVDLQDTAQSIHWSKPLSSLASSSDDGTRLLFFDIHGVGTVELEMATESDLFSLYKSYPQSQNRRTHGLCIVHSPKPIVFALHSFLSAKLASLGIIA